MLGFIFIHENELQELFAAKNGNSIKTIRLIYISEKALNKDVNLKEVSSLNIPKGVIKIKFILDIIIIRFVLPVASILNDFKILGTKNPIIIWYPIMFPITYKIRDASTMKAHILPRAASVRDI